MKRIYVTGDSHVSCLRKAWDLIKKFEDDYLKFDFTIAILANAHDLRRDFFEDKGTYAKFTSPKIRISQLPDLNNFDFYGFSMPYYTNSFFGNGDWRYFIPYCMKGEMFPLSKSLIEQAVLAELKYIIKFIDIFIRNNHKVFVVESPKPFIDNRAIIRKHISEELVLYLDTFYRNIVDRELEKRNVPVVKVPKESLDNMGFMKMSFRLDREDDAHHANAEHGRIMVKGIQDLCSKWPVRLGLKQEPCDTNTNNRPVVEDLGPSQYA